MIGLEAGIGGMAGRSMGLASRGSSTTGAHRNGRLLFGRPLCRRVVVDVSVIVRVVVIPNRKRNEAANKSKSSQNTL